MRTIRLVLVLLLGMALGGCPSKDDAVIASLLACDGAAVLDPKGNAVLPAEATDIEAPINVDEDLGSLVALYPGMDTTTDAFYPNLPCEPSIGGTLPADEPALLGEAESEEFLSKFEANEGAAILEQLRANPKPAISPVTPFAMGGCFIRAEATAGNPRGLTPVKCDDPAFLDSTMPFEGRDIIYVHGLDIHPIKALTIASTSLASKKWPTDSGEFLNAGGYFRTNAEKYWGPHITEHLSSTNPLTAATSGWQWASSDFGGPIYIPKPNRYLIVAWSSTQTIEYAQHALLTQIQLAMTTNLNVVTPPTYPAQYVKPFCANGCIIVGHSTGPLITSSAMGLASAGLYGPGGEEIPRHIVAHVSFDGAISGSRISSLFFAAASALSPSTVPSMLCSIIASMTGGSSCFLDLSVVQNSILRDLIPAVSQGVWGHAVDSSPVPTVTFAGGHPIGNQGLFRLFLPGVDDGVVTMNSACGNPNPVYPLVTAPSGMNVTSLLKAFDYSEDTIRFERGAGILIAQKNLKAIPPGFFYLAGACTPYLSAAGMVMPVLNPRDGGVYDARNRYRNHYSFMQSVAEHSYDGGNSTPNEWPSQFGFPATNSREYSPFLSQIFSASAQYPGLNLEESRAVTNPSIYTRLLDANGTRLVKPLDMHEIQRGRKIRFKLPWNIGGCTKASGQTLWRCQKWIWKRTYHLASKWEKKQSSHYAYEYVGRR